MTSGLRFDTEGAWQSAFELNPLLQVFLGVPSRVGPWQRPSPPRMLVGCDPTRFEQDLSDLSGAARVIESAVCGHPVWIPGDPQPTEAHFAEVAELNPAFRQVRWAES